MEHIKAILLAMIFILLSSMAHGDTWACTEQATVRSGDAWSMCGVGEGMDEGEARNRALNHALSEFTSMCDLDSGCKGKDRHVEPKRTTCANYSGWWKCFRMVQITLY